MENSQQLTEKIHSKPIGFIRPKKYSYKKKLQMGGLITTMELLIRELDEGNRVYVYGKHYHKGWVRSFQLSYILRAIRTGNVNFCVKTF